MLGVIYSNLKLVKIFKQPLWMLSDVVVVWSGLCNNIAPGHAHWLDFRHLTCRETSKQGGQTSATCCAQLCCEMLLSNVAIVWPELANDESTTLAYVVL